MMSCIHYTIFSTVSKNGQLVSSLTQEEKEEAKTSQKPRHHKMAKLDIPELDIHQQFEDNDEEDEDQDVRVNFVKRNVSDMMRFCIISQHLVTLSPRLGLRCHQLRTWPSTFSPPVTSKLWPSSLRPWWTEER